MIAFLLVGACVHGGEGEAGWTVRFAAGAVPKAIVPPLLDGADDDLCWRAPSAPLPAFRNRRSPDGSGGAMPPTRAWVACDAEDVYLFLHCRPPARNSPKRDARDTVWIEFGPAPWLRYRVCVDKTGVREEAVWDGWAWDATWRGGVEAKTKGAGRGWTAEIRLPRVAAAPAMLRDGASLAMRIRRRAGGVIAEMDLSRFGGLRLGVDAALVSLRRLNAAGSRKMVRITAVNWSGAKAASRITVRSGGPSENGETFLTSEFQSPEGVFHRTLSLQKAGLPTYGQAVAGWTVGERILDRQSFSLPVWRATDDESLLLDALPTPGDPRLPSLRAALLQKDHVSAAARLASLLHGRQPESRIPDSVAERRYETDRLFAAVIEREPLLLAKVVDGQGMPDWAVLDTLCQEGAHARAAYRFFATLAYLHKGLAQFEQHPTPDIATRLRDAYDSWNRYLFEQKLAYPDLRSPIWDPDVAVYRARILCRLAGGPFSTLAGRGALVPALAECLRTQRWILAVLEDDAGATPLTPALFPLLRANARDLPLFPEMKQLARQLPRGAALQLEAHVYPDGAGRIPCTDELRVLRELTRMGTTGERLPQAFVASDLETGKSTVERLLLYLSRRVLPTASLPQFDPLANDIDANQLALWGNQYCGSSNAWERFLPEGQVALGLTESAPATSGASEYGGLYALRAPQAGLVCLVAAPARQRWGSLGGAASRLYGALMLAQDGRALLRAPSLRDWEWVAPVTVAGQGPWPGALPQPGSPLPHHWVTLSTFDSLGAAWDFRPAGAGCERRVTLVKGSRQTAYVCVRDRIAAPAGATDLAQAMVLGPEGETGIQIVDADGVHPSSFPFAASQRHGVRLLRRAAGRTEAVFFLFPRAVPRANAEKGGQPEVYRLGVQEGKGSVVEVRLSDRLRDTWLFGQDGGLAGRFGDARMDLKGDMAVLRIRDGAVSGLSVIRATSVRYETRGGVAVSFSRRCDASLRQKPDRSWELQVAAPEDTPVKVDMEWSSHGQPVRRARLHVLPGTTSVFRPL